MYELSLVESLNAASFHAEWPPFETTIVLVDIANKSIVRTFERKKRCIVSKESVPDNELFEVTLFRTGSIKISAVILDKKCDISPDIA